MTRAWRTLNVLTLLLILGGLTVSAQTPVGAPVAPVGAQQVTPPAPPAQEPIIDRYVVGQARPPVLEGSELIELTLDQAYAIALEKNLELKVARMNPTITDYNLQALRAAYRTSFTGSYGYTNSLTPSNNLLDGVSSVTNVSQNYSTGVSQAVRWFGSPSISATFGNGRTSTNNVQTKLNPGFSSNLTLNYSMQLLRGFKVDNARNNWRTFPITKEITDIQLINTIETTKASVRNAYWQLRQAIESIEISRRALELAKKSFSDSLIKVEIGTSASIDTVTFETQVAQAEQAYLASQIGWRTAELNFKRLLVSGTDDDLYGKTINPTDRPTLTVQSVDIPGAVTKTLSEGTNLVISRKNLEMSRLGLEVTKGNLLPSLSFSARYGASGQGGTQHLSGGVIVPGGYGDAFSNLGSFSNPNWSLNFNVTYPLGQLSEKAAYAQAQIRLDQSVAQLKAQELTVSTAVINAGLNVSNSYLQYQASVKSREASERNADAAQVRFDNGLLTNFEVITAQNTLTNARLSELRALISYINAIAEFERVQKIGG